MQLCLVFCARLKSFLPCLTWSLLLLPSPRILAGQTVLTPLEKQALLAFNPSAKTFSSVTMSGTTTWVAGSLQDSGNVTLTCSADGSSSETWSLGSQPHSVASTSFASGRSCTYTDPKGAQHQDASLGCRRAIPWFAPWMSLPLLSSGSLLRTASLPLATGAEGATQVAYLTNVSLPSGQPSSFQKLLEQGTGVGVSYGLLTGLINQLDFNLSLDSDPAHVISYRIVFSDYRADAGFVLPHRIQRYIQRTLQADITINSITAE